MQDIDLKEVVQDYLQALNQANLERCMDLYADDSAIKFMSAVYHGKEAIEEWHRSRFAAKMQVVQVENINLQGNSVLVEGTVTSNKLKLWRIGTLSGKATFLFENGKIKETGFGLRVYNPTEGW